MGGVMVATMVHLALPRLLEPETYLPFRLSLDNRCTAVRDQLLHETGSVRHGVTVLALTITDLTVIDFALIYAITVRSAIFADMEGDLELLLRYVNAFLYPQDAPFLIQDLARVWHTCHL